MAEALLHKHAGDRFETHSAGTDPKGVNALTIKALAEIGIDASGTRSKGVKEYLGKILVSQLIIVCGEAEQSCPRTWPGVHNREFWPFDDPAAATGTEEEKLAKFRSVRDQIEAKIVTWVKEQSETLAPEQ